MNSYRTTVSRHQRHLKTMAISELQSSYSKVSKSKAHEEPDFIADLVVQALPKIADRWSTVLAPLGIDISLASVFCHQRPKVTFEHKGKEVNPKPELGDLLIAHIHHPKSGRIARRALLLQAKKTGTSPYAIHRSDQHQHILYSTWPEFKYWRPSIKESRHVTPTQPHDGAKYLLIETGRSEFCTYAVQPTLVSGTSLADELIGLLTLNAGRVFHNRQKSETTYDWSTVVWDVLKMSLEDKTGFTRRKAGYIRHARVWGRTHALSLHVSRGERPTHFVRSLVGAIAATKVPGNNGFDRQDLEYVVNEDGAGISTIVIETQVRENLDVD